VEKVKSSHVEYERMRRGEVLFWFFSVERKEALKGLDPGYELSYLVYRPLDTGFFIRGDPLEYGVFCSKAFVFCVFEDSDGLAELVGDLSANSSDLNIVALSHSALPFT
jgi:hypothetical protein